MSKLYCAYDREHKVLADHQCCECGLPLCSSCGYVDPPFEIEEINSGKYGEHKHYCNECFEKREKIEKIKTYCLYIKSHCEAPDFEVEFEAEVEATSKEEALKLFKEQYGMALCELDDDFLLSKIGLINS